LVRFGDHSFENKIELKKKLAGRAAKNRETEEWIGLEGRVKIVRHTIGQQNRVRKSIRVKGSGGGTTEMAVNQRNLKSRGEIANIHI